MLCFVLVFFILPRYGPHFETGNVTNITVQVGNTFYLHCKISLLQDKTVSKMPSAENIFLSSVFFSFSQRQFNFLSICDCMIFLGLMGSSKKWRERSRTSHSCKNNIFRWYEIFRRLSISKQLASKNWICTKNRRSYVWMSGMNINIQTFNR
jgi:hypothetical protein